jgi:hypothetical protein
MIELDYLSKLFDLCSKKGVESLKLENIEFKFKENFQAKKRIRGGKEEVQDAVMSEEAALFWSSLPAVGA